MDQIIGRIELAQIFLRHQGRQIGRITIPEQKVKGRRRLAHHVGTHGRRIDQIICPKEAEGLRHEETVQIAPRVNFAFNGFQKFLVNENAQFTGFLEIRQRGEIGCTLYPVIAIGSHMGKGDRQQCSANTIADGIALSWCPKSQGPCQRLQAHLL